MEPLTALLLLWPLILTRRPEQASPIWARRSLITLLTLLTARYLYWRCTASLNLSSGGAAALSLTLLVAEGWLLFSGLLPLWLAWRRFPDRRPSADQSMAAVRAGRWQPRVTILVPTCGEPLDVLERCLVGCCSQHYRHSEVWVLDDSGREEVELLARRLGCHYRHRPVRSAAKAGNLNDGLRLTHSDLIAVFDADFIPQRHYLERCVGFFRHPDVGLVQTPQHFINVDPVMRNLGMERWMLPDEESFYRWIQPVRDGWGAVVCAGTSFVARRSALEQIGGFVEPALSEDFVTGIALRRQGWSLLYLQEKLSAGLAAESMGDFVRQRQRWAAGTLQSLVLPEGPLRAQGLSTAERLAYCEGVVHWINHAPRLVLMLMPLSYGVLGVLPIQWNVHAVVNLLLPLWGTLLLSIGWLNRGSRAALLGELTSWVMTVPLTMTLLFSLRRGPRRFQITPKHRTRLRWHVNWPLAAPLLVLSALNLINLIRLSGQPLSSVEWRIGLTWACLNLISTLIAIRACVDPPAPDANPWLGVDQAATLTTTEGHRHRCRIQAISQSGVELTWAGSVPATLSGRELTWESIGPLGVREVQRTETQLVLEWSGLSQCQRHQLIIWLFCEPGCWLDRQSPREWLALLVLLRTTLFGRSEPGPLRRSLVPRRS
ncbi:glycosyltransferase [Parasynechococcus sp.]|uniref:glycosyltransferase family 2 protein n=1 Tax=Parasynechococcus sp. TaxID=3101203 RepID=UPI0037045577